MGSLELDTTERLHFPFSLSCIGEGNGNPLQCSCLENPRDGGAWWAAVYGVAQSRTRLRRRSSSISIPGILDPYKSLLSKSPPKYPNCHNAAPSDVVWNTIDGRSGYPIWKSCTYNSRIDYRIPGRGNYTIQDWSNPDPGQDPMTDDAFNGRFDSWKKKSSSLAITRH